ncbi:MAG: Do family serine endopeptidase [Fibrobacterota bacterium]
MKERKGVFSVAMLAVIMISVILFNCDFTFADDDNGSENSIKFGSEKRPELDLSGIGSFKTVFADIAEQVVPSVVSVIPTKIDTVVFRKNPFYHFFDDPGNKDGQNPFDFFFNPRRRQEPQVEKREYRQQGIGSGVIVSKDGYILTNYHVIKGADEIEVRTNDGRVFDAEIKGSDSLSDVAVIKLKGDIEDLPVAFLGDSDKLKPGDWTIAIGNPFSLTSTVTVGIVSALNRKVQNNSSFQNFIQTDAAINPGNSGGALVNIEGELIGINTMIYSRSGGYMGIGFAIPINMAKKIMEDLIFKGRVVRGWMGVSIQDLNYAARQALDIKDNAGVMVTTVYKGQPADKAGIKQGDVIMSVGGKKVRNVNELRNVIAGIKPGRKVSVTVIRDGNKKEVSLKIAERNQEKIKELSESIETGSDAEAKTDEDKKTGLKVANLSNEMRQKFGIGENASGVVITHIDPGAPAAASNIKVGDVIVRMKISGKDYVDTGDVGKFKKAASKLKKGDSVLLIINRGGNSLYAGFKIRG